MLASVSAPVTPTPYIPQRTQRGVSEEHNTATNTPITTIRTTTRHELLSPKAHGSSTTITSSDPDLRLVDHSPSPVDIILCEDNIGQSV
jgi:hypothetical protein